MIPPLRMLVSSLLCSKPPRCKLTELIAEREDSQLQIDYNVVVYPALWAPTASNRFVVVSSSDKHLYNSMSCIALLFLVTFLASVGMELVSQLEVLSFDVPDGWRPNYGL
jgi:hypothetical protein